MGQRRVLAIEHDWRLRKLIRANLEVLGLDVQEAVSGRHALQILEESRPDIILLDLDVPGMDAPQLVSSLRELLGGRRVPIVVTSDERADWRVLELRGVAGHLQKPFAVSALLGHIDRALRNGIPEGTHQPPRATESGESSCTCTAGGRRSFPGPCPDVRSGCI